MTMDDSDIHPPSWESGSYLEKPHSGGFYFVTQTGQPESEITDLINLNPDGTTQEFQDPSKLTSRTLVLDVDQERNLTRD